ncbi:G-protein coupled receptor dmsr-1-like [Mytilus galloprovincialis]|uniref:G-protein coupled receptor dmsr-1-like n=1 Tax=Mytilus galloprovincialis TaxID=29158 RepID=UPI003F7BF713
MNNTTSNVSNLGQCDQPINDLFAYACVYFTLHGYLSLAICCFGVPTNLVNIIILTRKSMRNPINNILTGIAISDAITMMSYIPFAIHFYIQHGLERTPAKYTFEWTWFLALHFNLSVTTHMISIWLGVCMSIVRYIYIKSMGIGKINIDQAKSVILVVMVFLISILFCIPNYCITKVRITAGSDNVYMLENLRLGEKDMPWIEALAAWIFILLGKIGPCILITISGSLLLYTLHVSQERTKALKGARVEERMRTHRRTTIMLLAIICMFIVAELPQSILLLIGIFKENFFKEEYALLGDTIDILALINNATNFIMYCAMSRQFRDILFEMTCKYLHNGEDASYSHVKAIQTKTSHVHV